jgi:ribulose-5-phosphate 4-epimerase/fuculose-1-phosphate aldolase
VEEAAWWFYLMERSCQVQLLARAAGGRSRIPDAVARSIAAQIGTPDFGWFQAQPIFARLYAAHPELGEA